MFCAVTVARADRQSSALMTRSVESAATVSLLLNDDFGVQGAGGPDRLQDGDHAAGVDVDAGECGDQVGHRGVGKLDTASLAGEVTCSLVLATIKLRPRPPGEP